MLTHLASGCDLEPTSKAIIWLWLLYSQQHHYALEASLEATSSPCVEVDGNSPTRPPMRKHQKKRKGKTNRPGVEMGVITRKGHRKRVIIYGKPRPRVFKVESGAIQNKRMYLVDTITAYIDNGTWKKPFIKVGIKVKHTKRKQHSYLLVLNPYHTHARDISYIVILILTTSSINRGFSSARRDFQAWYTSYCWVPISIWNAHTGSDTITYGVNFLNCFLCPNNW